MELGRRRIQRPRPRALQRNEQAARHTRLAGEAWLLTWSLWSQDDVRHKPPRASRALQASQHANCSHGSSVCHPCAAWLYNWVCRDWCVSNLCLQMRPGPFGSAALRPQLPRRRSCCVPKCIPDTYPYQPHTFAPCQAAHRHAHGPCLPAELRGAQPRQLLPSDLPRCVCTVYGLHNLNLSQLSQSHQHQHLPSNLATLGCLLSGIAAASPHLQVGCGEDANPRRQRLPPLLDQAFVSEQ
jgi:hypothetical protein